MFLYALKSPLTRMKYEALLAKFFNFASIPGKTLGVRSNTFEQKARADPNWATNVIVGLDIDRSVLEVAEALPGETRYDITDKDLIKFLKDVWMVHDIDLRLLFERIVYCDELKDEDKNILKLMYGKKMAERILANEYDRRKMGKDLKFKYEEEASQKFMNIQVKHRTTVVQRILSRDKKDKVIEKYGILNELMDGICFPSFIPDKA